MTPDTTTRVVHCKREPYDVYIGRPGPWGNPYKVGVDGSRDLVIALFEQWVSMSLDTGAVWVRGHLGYLRGKVLGCWCSPYPCHGDVLAGMADEGGGGLKEMGRMTKQKYRQGRWDKCTYYLRRHRSIPEARTAAARDNLGFDTSVWITALSKMLAKGEEPGDLIGKQE